MAGENHVFSPAYHPEEIEEIASICDHVIFNSFSQLRHFGAKVKAIQQARGIAHGIGLRINPECSTQDHAIYDPCAPGSRLGVIAEDFARAVGAEPQLWDLLDGLHFHTLCEQNSDALAKTLQAVEQKFGCWLQKDNIHWLNMGGGHHITRADYDRQLLIDLVKGVKEKYAVEVYLEPGEAVALNAGYLVTEVLDTVKNHGVNILLLDASAACHMPDVLEMPYRPPLKGSGEAGEKAYTYKLSSCTCLAGDIIGDYSFDREILPGDRLYFEDMAIYSMVKNNTFNGMALPSIWKMDASGECTLVRKFGYKDFKERLS
jgi:carboxynorspermidine decarboxylase